VFRESRYGDASIGNVLQGILGSRLMGRSTGYWEVSYEMYSTLASGGAFHIVTPTWESLEVFGSCDITTLHRIIISIELVNACGGYGMTVPRWPCLLLCMERQVKVPCGARITEIPSPHVVYFPFRRKESGGPPSLALPQTYRHSEIRYPTTVLQRAHRFQSSYVFAFFLSFSTHWTFQFISSPY
jgi:hypothetical protein